MFGSRPEKNDPEIDKMNFWFTLIGPVYETQRDPKRPLDIKRTQVSTRNVKIFKLIQKRYITKVQSAMETR